MKKSIIAMLTLLVVASLVACAGKDNSATGTAATDVAEKSEGVMTYAEYVAAPVDSEVVVETYIQDKQGWWEKDGVGVATFYTQDQEGGYFLYNMPCTEEEYGKLTLGTKIKVTGFKSEWSGEVEITDATFEIEDGEFIAKAKDCTADLGTDALADSMNQLVSFTGLTVEDAGDGQAFLYNWDGSGEAGTDADLYFNASLGDQTYTFTVEYYLCNEESDAYKAVTGLNIGDTIDLEGFLYWYEGAQPHVTKVTVK